MSKKYTEVKSIKTGVKRMLQIQEMSGKQIEKKFGSLYPGSTPASIKTKLTTEISKSLQKNEKITFKKMENFLTTPKSTELLGSLNKKSSDKLGALTKKLSKKAGKENSELQYGKKSLDLNISFTKAMNRHKLALQAHESNVKLLDDIAGGKGEGKKLLSGRGTIQITTDGNVYDIPSSTISTVVNQVIRGVEGMSPFKVARTGNVRLNDPNFLNSLRNIKNQKLDDMDIYATELKTVYSMMSEDVSLDMKLSDKELNEMRKSVSKLSEVQKIYLGVLMRENIDIFYDVEGDYLSDDNIGTGKKSITRVKELIKKAKKAKIEKGIR